MPLPVDIYSVATVRQLDQIAINDAGIGGYALMSRAGQAALDVGRASFPDAGRWQVVCGAGNNGGDGYVIARLAQEAGIDASVLAVASPASLKGDAATAYEEYAEAGGSTDMYSGQLDDGADVLIDAVLGSGLARDLEGRYAEAVHAMNSHAAPVIAVDVPSGLNADTGAVMGNAVQASATVTFVGLKSGLFLDQGPDCAGELHFSDLDIPADVYASQPAAYRRIDSGQLASLLPARDRSAHKGDFGHLLIVGGGPGMSGAVRLAGEAALRSGAGLVSVATHPSHHAIVASGRPELMCHPIAESADLKRLVERATTIAVGPGLGTGDWSRTLFDAVIRSDRPLVVDADALNLLSENPSKRNDWVLTPHPGEAARLLKCTNADVQANRPGALARIAEEYGGTIVLKGAGSLVSSVDGVPWLCTAGNPGMAAPGMGDVLTGIIGALRAQGLAAPQAAMCGVEVHGRAGDEAAGPWQRGLLATDLMLELRYWLNP